MIRTLVVTDNHELRENVTLGQLNDASIRWYWVDFDNPNEDEGMLLESFFHFHPLAVEDCFHFRQRSKMDYYDEYNFFILHALNQTKPEELDLFVGKHFIVSFHFKPLREVQTVRNKIMAERKIREKGPMFTAYLLIDQLVDEYFPIVYQIEDHLNEIENNSETGATAKLVDEVFDIRGDLLRLRRTILPMRELVYRIQNSSHIELGKELKTYFGDVYDHLLKLVEIIESNRELTADIRDNYLSLNSNRMNTIMMTLTVISSIFIPLTFIAGVYGMNFSNMPELHWHYGYYFALGFMFIIGFGMYYWFKRKGWFEKI